MLKFIGRRTLQNLLVFIVFLTATFFLLQAQPGDITQQLLSNPKIPPDARRQFAEQLGLTGSVVEQYINYIRNFFVGNLGVSFSEFPRPVIDILLERLPRTIALFFTATLLAFWMGFVSGKFLAWRRGGAMEQPVTLTGVFLQTVFYPWFALMMIVIFAATFAWLPIGKFITVDVWQGSPFAANHVFGRMLWSSSFLVIGFGVVQYLASRMPTRKTARQVKWIGRLVLVGAFVAYWVSSPMARYAGDIAYHLILPVLTLSLVVFGGNMLLTRQSMLETLREDFILTARAKGVSEGDIRDRHAARNALLPVVTSLVLSLAFVIGGGVVTETVFSWPGMGQVLLSAAQQEDIPLTIGAFSLIGVLALVAHLVVDILYMYLDPRIRYQ